MSVAVINTNTTYAVSPGIYWLGDPCYAVPNDLWQQVVDELYRGDVYQDVATVDGMTLIAFQTKYGDGIYTDEDGADFSVDAGLIGLTPIEFWDDSCSAHAYDQEEDTDDALGHWVEVREPGWVCHDDEGVLHFGPWKIDTAEE